MKNKKRVIARKSFGTAEIIMAVLVILLFGLAGWRVVHANSLEHNSPESLNSIKPSARPSMDIAKWGVRVSFEDADKVENIVSDDGSFTMLYLDRASAKVIACREIGISITRNTESKGFDNEVTVGNYYYEVDGAPGACSEDPGGIDSPTNNLRSKIVQEFVTKKFKIVPIENAKSSK